MPDEQNKLYLLIGEIKAGVDDLKKSHCETQKDIKEIRSEITNVKLATNGIKPVISGAGLGGIFGAATAYLTKFLS